MKILIVIPMIFCSLMAMYPGDSTDVKAVEKVVTSFANGADNQDVTTVDAVLHPDFRSVVNRLFGAETVSLMDKPTYLKLLEEKKIGGDKRRVQIISTDIVKNNAIVKVKLVGKKLVFTSYISLVKDTEENWQIIQDMPDIEKL